MKRSSDPHECARELQLAVIRYCYSPSTAKRRAITTWLKRHQRALKKNGEISFRFDASKMFPEGEDVLTLGSAAAPAAVAFARGGGR